jgi:hypothetical protein
VPTLLIKGSAPSASKGKLERAHAPGADVAVAAHHPEIFGLRARVVYHHAVAKPAPFHVPQSVFELLNIFQQGFSSGALSVMSWRLTKTFWKL